ncbi:MAG: hypothetical protein RIC35_05370 [Marinoscillum sp.]
MKKISLLAIGFILLASGFFLGVAIDKRFQRIQPSDHEILMLEAQLNECRND